METSEKARQRMEVILQVQAGQLKATEGAEALGVARKTYYEWEHRALEGMLTALTDRDGGRPVKPHDPEKEALQNEVEDLKIRLELAEKAQILQKMLDDFERQQKSPSPDSGITGKKKKKRKSQ